MSDVSNNAPSQVADHFRIGSITKTMTATVVLQLVQEGKGFARCPADDLPPGREDNGATVRQALQMTSGIGTYTTMPFLNGLADNPQKVWPRGTRAAWHLGKAQLRGGLTSSTPTPTTSCWVRSRRR